MTRKAALKLLAAVAAAFTSTFATAQQPQPQLQEHGVTGVGKLMPYRQRTVFSLELGESHIEEFQVHYHGDTLTITADELWHALNDK